MLLDAGSHFCCMLDHFTCIHTVTRRIHLWSNFGCGLHGYMLSEKKTDSSLVEDVGDHLVLEANLGIYFVTHRLVKFCFCYEENQRPAFTNTSVSKQAGAKYLDFEASFVLPKFGRLEDWAYADCCTREIYYSNIKPIKTLPSRVGSPNCILDSLLAPMLPCYVAN